MADVRPKLMFGRRILILAPHPDDEVVCCAAAIGRARTGGADIRVLHLTTGVPEAAAFWPWQRPGHAARVARRRAEAERAAGTLGIAVAGFGDIASRCLRRHLHATRAAVAAAIDAFEADALWVPAFEGAHQDHDAANAVAATLAGRVAVTEFAAYRLAPDGPRSQDFAEPGPDAVTLDLTADERAAKRAALALYASEHGNLGHIAAAREAARPLPAHDYARPPHPGRLFWTRFQWVP
ncbi:MAG: PIG-L family deacetylase, partial [Alphaproteobacteria bacterium]